MLGSKTNPSGLCHRISRPAFVVSCNNRSKAVWHVVGVRMVHSNVCDGIDKTQEGTIAESGIEE